MRLYVSSRGHAGVSFGWFGALLYAFGWLVLAVVTVALWLLYALAVGVAWLVRELAAWIRERRQPAALG